MMYTIFDHDGEEEVHQYRTRNFVYQNFLKFKYTYEIDDAGKFSWVFPPKTIGNRPSDHDILMHKLKVQHG